MGKRYYCDYCERSFADGAENRKKHLASVNHQKLRKMHYDQFKDAKSILEENKRKKPCRKFLSTGFCEFESSCKFSHLLPEDLDRLQEQACMEELKGISTKRRGTPDIDSWIEAKILKIEKPIDNIVSRMQHPVSGIPSVLANIPDLPPSLIPGKTSDLLNHKDSSQWG